MANIKKNVLLVSLSDFGLGRARYIAIALLKLDFNVIILCNKALYRVSEEYQEDIFINDNKKINRIKIISFPNLKLPYNTIIGRLITYCWMTIWFFLYMIKNYYFIDIILLRHPHPFTDVAGVLYKKINKKVTLLSDITDLWPDDIKYIPISKTIKKILIVIGNSINKLVDPKLDFVVTLNQPMKRNLKQRNLKNIHVFYGVIDLDIFRPMYKDEAFKNLPSSISEMVSNKFVILYAGIMSYKSDPLIMVKLAKRVKKDYQDMIFIVLGEGHLKHKLKEEIKRHSLDNIVLISTKHHEEMPYVYNIADVTILPPPTLSVNGMYGYYKITLPKKFIEYSACGKPILCITPPCVASELCSAYRAGFHIEPSSMAITHTIKILSELKGDENLRNSIAKNSRLMAENLFSLEHGVSVLKSILHP